MINIAFVYDLEFCKTETDDVYSAILYFHPSWVVKTQRFSLCGQLMGVLQFVTECFSRPKLISLQNGKFVIKRYGRFVLAIGTDRYIDEKILMHRASLLINIFELYHYSINSLFELFDDRVRFADKLYHIFETHLPLLQYNGNLLQNIYKLHLPKSASNLYLNAIQILENCQGSNVLGGVILYHNKVLATQLSADLTKILVTTDPQRIRTTGEMINVNYHQPNGCHLIKIYIKMGELHRLKRQIKRSTLSTQNAQNTLPFIIKKKQKDQQPSLMKPSKSIIFTNIPEEEALVEVPSPIEPPTDMKPMRILKPRPNHLPLKLKTMHTKDLPESGIASINFDETDSFPDFIGRTSVCSTPMTENKLLIGPMVSIFANNDNNNLRLAIQEEPIDMAPKKVQKFKQVFINFGCNPFKQFQRKSSWSELNHISELKENTENLLEPSYNVYNTISDPTCAIFNQKRMPLSNAMFEEFQELNKVQLPLIEDNKLPIESPQRYKKSVFIESSPKKMETNNKVKNSRKKMLMLPLKSLTTEKEFVKPMATSGSLILESPSLSKNFMGNLQLTPLMSKLTLLAMTETEIHSSGFSSFDIQTPTTNYYSNLETPIDNKFFSSRLKTEDDIVEDESDEMVKVDLFICGQQNMSLILIMDENSSSSQSLVQSMFDLCVARLNRLEMKLNDIININLDNGDKSNDYSFINLDKKWEILKRGGGLQLLDLQSLLLMHNNFAGNSKLSDIILRSDDSVLYGYQSGETEIFYQQPSQKQAGLPPPTDKMGTITSAAKRRLERDHSLVLF